ncbi:glycosyl hydrolase, partial [Flavobacteriaceae bacterium]|nr:glycosyl hydrolase [Flavobacteriaceae bacterium]
MNNLKLLLLLICVWPLTSQAQNQKKTTKTEVKNENLDSNFHHLKWRNIGPFRGGRSVTSTGVVGQPHVYYMGSTGGGIWKTTDAGTTWLNISDGFLKTGTVGAIAVSESDPNVVIVGMGEHAARGVMTSMGDGVYKSTDAGKTWKHIGLEASRHISDIIIHPNNPDIFYVTVQGAQYGPSMQRGVYRTQDGGTNWQRVLYVDDITGASSLSMDMNNPRILYASMWQHQRYPWIMESGGDTSGLYKSTDGGSTWEQMKNGLPQEFGKSGISVSRANSNRVFAVIEAEGE